MQTFKSKWFDGLLNHRRLDNKTNTPTEVMIVEEDSSHYSWIDYKDYNEYINKQNGVSKG